MEKKESVNKSLNITMLNLDEIAKLVNLYNKWKNKKGVGATTNIKDQVFNIIKGSRNGIEIKSSDGRYMSIEVNKIEGMYQDRYRIGINLYLKEHDYIKLSMTLLDSKIIPGTYDIVTYIGSNNRYIDLNKKLEPFNISFKDDYIFYNPFDAKISKDGKKVLSIAGVEVTDNKDKENEPNYESIRKKLELLNRVIQVRAIHLGVEEYTKGFFTHTIELARRKEQENKSNQIDSEEILEEVNESLKAHERIQKSFLDSIFTKKELLKIIETIENLLKGKNTVIEEDKPDQELEDIKKLVRELKPRDQTKIIDLLNNGGDFND